MTTVFPRTAALTRAIRLLGGNDFHFDATLLLSASGLITLWVSFSGINAEETNERIANFLGAATL